MFHLGRPAALDIATDLNTVENGIGLAFCRESDRPSILGIQRIALVALIRHSLREHLGRVLGDATVGDVRVGNVAGRATKYRLALRRLAELSCGKARELVAVRACGHLVQRVARIARVVARVLVEALAIGHALRIRVL
jgi:hypothetical protein